MKKSVSMPKSKLPFKTKNVEPSKKLTEKVKKASLKILRDHGYSLPQIEKLTGVPTSTVDRIVKGDLSDIEPEIWDQVGNSIARLMTVTQNKLALKIMGKMDHELDTKSLPFGSLAFGLKVLGDLMNPKGVINQGNTINNIQVKVVRESADSIQGEVISTQSVPE